MIPTTHECAPRPDSRASMDSCVPAFMGVRSVADKCDTVHRPGSTHTTVGIRIAHGSHARDLRPCQIQLIIPGTSAHLCGL